MTFGTLPLNDKYENFAAHMLDSKTKLKVSADYQGSKVGRPTLDKRSLQEAKLQHTLKNDPGPNTDIEEINSPSNKRSKKCNDDRSEMDLIGISRSNHKNLSCQNDNHCMRLSLNEGS